jgi:hypothetical protein
MTIQFETAPHGSLNGTCLQGYIKTTYDELVNVFGKPTILKGDKVNVEWNLLFSDGTVASIYDWKLSETPMGVYDWHIGGYTQNAIECVKNCMPVTA